MLFRKKFILAKIEATYGVDPNPTGSLDAILTKNLQINTFQGNKVGLDYDRPYLSAEKQLYTGPYTTLSFDVDLAGSGTAGVIAPYGVLLRAAGFAEIINAAAVTGTATAGAAKTITLAASAAAIDDKYNGLLITITAGTGIGQIARIADYVGATKLATVSANWTTPPDATSQYSIGAQVVYAPVSAGQESTQIYFYMENELHKLKGARGTVVVDISKEALPLLKFTFTGLRVPAATSAAPTADFTKFKEPLPVNDTNTTDLTVHGYSARTESISFDIGNTVTYRNVVNSENVTITDRDPKMTVSMEKPLLTEINYDAIIASQVAGPVSVIHGNAAGKIVRVDAGSVQLTDPSFSDSDGIALLGMNGGVLPTLGDDELYITCL